jgi:hypothetical protein
MSSITIKKESKKERKKPSRKVSGAGMIIEKITEKEREK